MRETKDFQTFFAENTLLLKEYLDTKVEIIKLKTTKTVVKALGGILATVVTMLFVFIIFMLMMIGLSLWLSQRLDNYLYGFGIVSGGLLIIMFIVIAMGKKTVKTAISRSLLKASDLDNDEPTSVNS